MDILTFLNEPKHGNMPSMCDMLCSRLCVTCLNHVAARNTEQEQDFSCTSSEEFCQICAEFVPCPAL